MRLVNNQTDSVFLMPKEVLKIINNAKKSEIKLILYIFANIDKPFDEEIAAQELGETVQSISSALAFWRGSGIISQEDDGNISLRKKTGVSPDKKQEKAEPVLESRPYSTTEVSEALLSDTEFKQLVNYAEHTLGELLNPSKVASLLYLYDNLGMQCDVIMGIIAYCVSIDKGKLRYVEKTAQGMHNDGVVTYKDLESYLANKKKYAEYESMVKRVIGAENRSLTSSEAKHVQVWEKEYKANEELVKLAYDKTISTINKPSMPYMSKILESWFKNGLDSAQKVLESEQTNKAESKKNVDNDSSFDFSLEDIFERP